MQDITSIQKTDDNEKTPACSIRNKPLLPTEQAVISDRTGRSLPTTRRIHFTCHSFQYTIAPTAK